MPNATAYRITPKDVETIANATGFSTDTLRSNLNWIVVVDYRGYYPDFQIMPERIFKDNYPSTEITKPVSLM